MVEIMAALSKSNPGLSNALSGQIASMVAEGVKFIAFDVYSESISVGFVTNVNVVRISKPEPISLDTAVKETINELKKQLKDYVVGPVTSNRLTSDGGEEIARINYDLTINAPDGRQVAMSGTQYVAVTENDFYVVTCTALTNDVVVYARMFDKIGQSLQLFR